MPSSPRIDGDAFDRVMTINLKSMVLACKLVLPIMREQQAGSITTISSIAALIDYAYISYKTSKRALSRSPSTSRSPMRGMEFVPT